MDNLITAPDLARGFATININNLHSFYNSVLQRTFIPIISIECGAVFEGRNILCGLILVFNGNRIGNDDLLVLILSK